MCALREYGLVCYLNVSIQAQLRHASSRSIVSYGHLYNMVGFPPTSPQVKWMRCCRPTVIENYLVLPT